MMFLLVVTLSSMVLAAIMSVIAWRIAAEERRRSEARVAALAEEIHAPAAAQPRAAAQSAGARRADVGLRAEPRPTSFPAPRSAPRWDDLPLRPVDRAAAAPELFATTQAERAGSGLGIVAAVCALVFAVGLALMIGLGRGLPPADGGALHLSRTAPIAGQAPAATAAPIAAVPSAAAPATVPLELVALGHERESDRLTVRGVVRNPASGAPVERLTAVVFAFNADGGFLASGRAIIDASAALRPGGESTFVVTVPGAGAVGRYRVSFRTDDRVVPHVDRRDPPKTSS
jgi:hypothetical protein